jgi:FkbM family methyltransferase
MCFEPGEAFFWLLGNLEFNGLRNAHVRRMAVAAANAMVSFTSGKDAMNRIARNGSAAVPITTLGATCRERAQTLIKIDVEGFAADVLRGVASILGNANTQAVIMELNDPGARELLEEQRFTCCSYDPFKRSIFEIEGSPDRKLSCGDCAAVQSAGMDDLELAYPKDRVATRSPTVCAHPSREAELDDMSMRIVRVVGTVVAPRPKAVFICPAESHLSTFRLVRPVASGPSSSLISRSTAPQDFPRPDSRMLTRLGQSGTSSAQSS